MKFFSALSACLMAAASAFRIASTSTPHHGMTSSLCMGNIVELCRFEKPRRLTFKTLYKAIVAAGLEDTLSGPGPFTIFAPTDAAFDAVPPDALAGLLADPAALKKVLMYHVVAGKIDGEAIKAMKKIPTLEGSSVTISTDEKSFFTDDAKLQTVDIDVDNGWVHAIDLVMMPGK